MIEIDPFWLYCGAVVIVVLALGIMPSLRDPDYRDRLPKSSFDL